MTNCALDLEDTFQAITCRGVLNDLVSDAERDAALVSFMGALKPGGLLLLDVREADGARRRADGVERRTDARLADGSHLVFTSCPTWDDGLIDVEERYELTLPNSSTTSTHAYRFQMRPWTAEELQRRMAAAGFLDVEVRPGAGRQTPDRLFVVARRP